MSAVRTPLEIYDEMKHELVDIYNAVVVRITDSGYYDDTDKEAENYQLLDLEDCFHYSADGRGFKVETEGLIKAGQELVKAFSALGWTMEQDGSRYQTIRRPCREGDTDYDPEYLDEEISVNVRFSDHGNQSRMCGDKIQVNVAPGADTLKDLAEFLTECDRLGEWPGPTCYSRY